MRTRLLGIGLLAALLVACGGGDSSSDAADPAPLEASATIGVAGGTLALADGATLVVPAGALSADVRLRMVKSRAGAPAVPDELDPQAPVYEITPHDTRFLAPVQLRLPLPAGSGTDVTALVATAADGWATQPARVEGNTLVLERAALSWYSMFFSPVCAPVRGSTDPYPCRLPILLPSFAATPPTAVDSSFMHVTQAARIVASIDFRAHPDCNDARVLAVRRSTPAGVNASTTATTVADLALPMQTLASGSLTRSAIWTLDTQIDHRDNGSVVYDVRMSCTRGYQGRRVTAYGLLTLLVNAPVPSPAPTILRAPATLSVTDGQAAAFEVEASAPAGLAITWQKSTDNGATWLDQGAGTAIANGSRLAFTAQLADHGTRFRARVCNGSGATQTCISSADATLSVTPLTPGMAPQITTQPADQSLSANGSASFTAAASGSPAPVITWTVGSAPVPPGQGGLNIGNCSFDYDAQGGTLGLSSVNVNCTGLVVVATATNSAGSAQSREARIAAATATAVLLAGEAGTRGAVDGPLEQARFATPNYLAFNAQGQLAVADFGNHAVRLVAAGAVSTLAGGLGQPGFADGTGNQARFNGLGGLAFDSAGNLFVADWDNHVIRRITPAGVVSTFAGSPGVAGSDDGTGAAARFRNPNGLVVDAAGTVYVADWGNHTIRAITPAGVVSTLAGTAGQAGSADGSGAAARFSQPSGLALLGSDRLVVGDQGNHTLRSVSKAGVVGTLAGAAGQPGHVDGSAASARFTDPAWVATSADGRIFVVSGAGDTVRRVALDGSVQTLVGVPGDNAALLTGTNPRLRNARGLWVDAGGKDLLLLADQALLRIALP